MMSSKATGSPPAVGVPNCVITVETEIPSEPKQSADRARRRLVVPLVKGSLNGLDFLTVV